ncbi:MAG: hypothetical protein U9Q96_02115 [Patescibacteria group bacterium]|nr:hypothetical protein [Patescibacteria group bacterium]
METIKSNSKPVRIFFFWSGIIATLSYRIIIILNFYSPLWVKIAWYIGTIGFIIYFGHRFDIQRKRAKLVEELKLVEAVKEAKDINKKRTEALCYLLKTSLTSRSRWNSAFIFFMSVIALIIGIILDIF